MIFTCQLTSDIEINTLEDLNKLKDLTENNDLKVNYSKLAREFGKDRRTIKKYIQGYSKSKTRKRRSQFDGYYPIIENLLKDSQKTFVYKRILYSYLKDNYQMPGAQSSFRRYISSIKDFQSYFEDKDHTVRASTNSRYETLPGKQAQLDWKESMEILLSTGESITINIFVLILSYSRFRVYRLSLTKTQDVLFHFLDEAFVTFGGVPETILTDNMRTVMDVARTVRHKGKVNNRFQQFADDYGFEVHPCIAGRPETKSKVESPMRILDELRAYGGELTLEGLTKKLEDINNRENTSYHRGYRGIPIFDLKKEKDLLKPLPNSKIRDHYHIVTKTVKVNHSSMITYKGNQYSLPPEHIGKILQLQVYDDRLHLYSNKKLIAIHHTSEKKINYLEEHYIEILKRTLPFKDEDIKKIAEENLKAIGERYNEDDT